MWTKGEVKKDDEVDVNQKKFLLVLAGCIKEKFVNLSPALQELMKRIKKIQNQPEIQKKSLLLEEVYKSKDTIISALNLYEETFDNIFAFAELSNQLRDKFYVNMLQKMQTILNELEGYLVSIRSTTGVKIKLLKVQLGSETDFARVESCEEEALRLIQQECDLLKPQYALTFHEHITKVAKSLQWFEQSGDVLRQFDKKLKANINLIIQKHQSSSCAITRVERTTLYPEYIGVIIEALEYVYSQKDLLRDALNQYNGMTLNIVSCNAFLGEFPSQDSILMYTNQFKLANEKMRNFVAIFSRINELMYNLYLLYKKNPNFVATIKARLEGKQELAEFAGSWIRKLNDNAFAELSETELHSLLMNALEDAVNQKNNSYTPRPRSP